MTNERTHVDKGQAQAAYSALDVERRGAHESCGRRPRRGPSKVGGQLKTMVFDGLDGILTSLPSCRLVPVQDSHPVRPEGACNILAEPWPWASGNTIDEVLGRVRQTRKGQEDWSSEITRGRGRGDEVVMSSGACRGRTRK